MLFPRSRSHRLVGNKGGVRSRDPPPTKTLHFSKTMVRRWRSGSAGNEPYERIKSVHEDRDLGTYSSPRGGGDRAPGCYPVHLQARTWAGEKFNARGKKNPLTNYSFHIISEVRAILLSKKRERRTKGRTRKDRDEAKDGDFRSEGLIPF